MRALLLLSIAASAACYEAPPPVMPDPLTESAVVLLPKNSDAPSASDQTPRVVRRLVAEAKEQVAKNRQMVAELPDARGRARANQEASAIEAELDELSTRINDASSDNLDDVMSKLHLLDTRIDILHDRLRAATLRTTAVAKD